MNSDRLNEILMFGIEEMYEMLKASDNENFDMEKAKVKIATNNSLTLSAKALIQNEVLKTTLLTTRQKEQELNHKVLKGE